MQNSKFLQIPKLSITPPPVPSILTYNELHERSFDNSNLIDNIEDANIDSFSHRSLIDLPHSSPQTIELHNLKPLRNNEDIILMKKRLNSVIEEVEEEDLSINKDRGIEITGLTGAKNMKYMRKNTEHLTPSPSHKRSYMEKLSLRYRMSPSIANNSLILKPDITIHGVNFKETEKSPKHFEWFLSRARSSFKAPMLKNHMHFLKVHSNIHNSILPLIKSIVYVIVDALQAIISIFSCILYVIGCYVDKNDVSTLNFLHIAELIITLIFTFDLLRHFIEAKDKLMFFLNIHTIIDLMAIIPYFISLISTLENSLNFLHILQIFRLIRILRLYRLFNDPDIESSDQINEARFSFDRQLAIFLCTIFAGLFIFSGISYELNGIFENSYMVRVFNKSSQTYEDVYTTDEYTFFYAFYFLFQTFLTLGFGDVSPVTASSRLFVSIVIIVYSLILIDQLYKLNEVRTKISKYDFDYKRTEHLVIIGYFNENNLQRMFMDLFREDSCFKEHNILIVREVQPSVEMLMLMEKFSSQHSDIDISYLLSCFMKDDIIIKANIKKAKAIFLMNDPIIKDNDKEIVMLMNVFQDYNAFIRKVVQINDQNIIWNFSPLINPWNIFFSPIKLKILLLVNSMFNKGLIPLFNNLMSSQTVLPLIKTNLEIQWFMEYTASILQSVFLVSFSDFFLGKTFKYTSKLLYRSKSKYDYLKGLLLMGIKTFDIIEQNKGNIYMNPQNYTIKRGDCAIVIAKNKETAQFISFYVEEVDINDTKMELLKENYTDNDPLSNIHSFEQLLYEELAAKKALENSFYCEKINKNHILLWKTDISARMTGHIIVSADERNFEAIIQAIRSRTMKPVCFFIEKPPNPRSFELITKYPWVFLLEGNLLNIKHLKHANISHSFHVLIFTQLSDDISYNIDSKAILLANIIEEFFNIPYTMEISDVSELKLLGFRSKKEFTNLGLSFDPQFMSGNILPSNTVDSMSVYLLENEILLDMARKMCGNDRKNKGIFENSRIFSIACPQCFYGKKYEDFLIKAMSIKSSIIPLGILTMKFTRINTQKFNGIIGELNQSSQPGSPFKRVNQMVDDDHDPRILKLPLFLMNPLPTTVLNKGDVLILMGEVRLRKKKRKNENFNENVENQEKKIEIVENENREKKENIFENEGVIKNENLEKKTRFQEKCEEVFQRDEIFDGRNHSNSEKKRMFFGKPENFLEQLEKNQQKNLQKIEEIEENEDHSLTKSIETELSLSVESDYRMKVLENEGKVNKEKNSERFKEIVELMKKKLLNYEVIEEIAQQKEEMIDKLEGIVDEKKLILRKMNNGELLKEFSSTLFEDPL